jgi:RNA polymerase sigma factor (sigma-70 family)
VEHEELPMSGRADDPSVDSAVFERAFTEYFPVIHRYLARRVGTVCADDLAAEAFAVAFRRRRSFDPSRGPLRAWLFGIATVLLRAHWREEQRLLNLEARLWVAGPEECDGADKTVFDEALSPRMARALTLLPIEQRDVLLLHVWGELSGEEIAASLDIPAGTIRSRLSRARASLREHLGSFDLEPWLFAEEHQPAMEDQDQ